MEPSDAGGAGLIDSALICGLEIKRVPSSRRDQKVSATERSDAPIYERLIRERGDVAADARKTAEATWRDVGRIMDFRLPHAIATQDVRSR